MSAPQQLPAEPRPLSEQQRKWYEQAASLVSPDLLREIVADMTNIPSPTGEERALAEYLVARGLRTGLDAFLQPLDDLQANAVLRRAGDGSGPDLLLYAPIDTHTTGLEDEDLPWVGPALREDMLPKAFVEGPYVVGLGANNPKGHAACLVAAVDAVARAGVPLRGTLMAGFGAGGMPSNRRPDGLSRRYNQGHGVGCSFMLEQGVRPDFAIIAKTGWAVSWEEVGLAWFKLQVRGGLNYTGVRHFVDYRNPIIGMAKVIEGLERWFPEYTRRNSSGLVAPQGSIGAIEGGWTYKPTFVPAACDLYVDLRLSPRTGPLEARRQLQEAVDEIAGQLPGLELSLETVVAVPGSTTDPANWVVQSTMRGWQEVEGRAHESRGNQSGATDANILRGRGVPTARVGLARVSDDAPMPDDFSKGMNVVDTRTMERLTRCLIYGAIDTCTRSRQEVGLA
jgi:acetylornithine deacetylase/succinyl-diaminopimelate desuccinylase-like protein